ncbi:MAG TPA: hypothetical protein VFL91_12715 [Thermomicrobiales bacterium]|nr:hypothetical protein [Thermomicrobiales bacterium]
MSATAEPVGRDPRRWFGMAVLGLGVSLIIVDATIVNVAVPTISERPGATRPGRLGRGRRPGYDHR